MKKILIVVLLLLMIPATTAFAYWASINLVETEESNEVLVGEGETATVSLSVSDNLGSSQLVPVGQATNSIGNPVESVEFTFDILWEDNRSGITDGVLNIVVLNVQGDPDNLLNFTFVNGQVIEVDDALQVVITVTMNEPADETEYNNIINANITFDVEFTVVPN